LKGFVQATFTLTATVWFLSINAQVFGNVFLVAIKNKDDNPLLEAENHHQ